MRLPTQPANSNPGPADAAAPARRSRRRTGARARGWLGSWQGKLALFFAVFGPGFITANVDNDPGGIFTLSQAGAQTGYLLLWTLIPITIALIVVQEMAARMGAVTGKGLSDLIREEFGFRWTFFAMLVLGAADFGNLAAEFSGLAAGMGIFGISKYIAVTAGAVLVWLLVTRGRHRGVEKILIFFSLIYIAYPISAFLAHPDWKAAIRHTVIPTFIDTHAYLFLLLGLIGTTITPWMQFYLQASIVEKGIGKKEYALSRWDVISGCIITDVVSFFIIAACAATLFIHGHHNITDAAQAAAALRPLAGRFAALLFAIGLINAALLSAAVLPLATSYNICEGLGFESGIDKRFSDAPAFYWLYTGLIAFGAGFVLIPHLPLLRVILISQVANGILLPVVLTFMLVLINRESVMGSYRNSRLFNWIAWTTSVVIVVMTAGMLATL